LKRDSSHLGEVPGNEGTEVPLKSDGVSHDWKNPEKKNDKIENVLNMQGSLYM
jgi:hypothetical protein